MKKDQELIVITRTYDLILWSCNHFDLKRQLLLLHEELASKRILPRWDWDPLPEAKASRECEWS